MPYRRCIFSIKDASFFGGAISFEIIYMVQFGLLIKIKYWFNGNEWKGIMKGDNSNGEAEVYL